MTAALTVLLLAAILLCVGLFFYIQRGHAVLNLPQKFVHKITRMFSNLANGCHDTPNETADNMYKNGNLKKSTRARVRRQQRTVPMVNKFQLTKVAKGTIMSTDINPPVSPPLVSVEQQKENEILPMPDVGTVLDDSTLLKQWEGNGDGGDGSKNTNREREIIKPSAPPPPAPSPSIPGKLLDQSEIPPPLFAHTDATTLPMASRSDKFITRHDAHQPQHQGGGNQRTPM